MILWHCIGAKSQYKPYGKNEGSGWTGRYEWNNRVIGYTNKENEPPY
jgi:hypothetical protein